MIPYNRESFPYISTARSAHDLAEVLKRVRPRLRDDVNLLQGVVTKSHQRLENEAISSGEIAQAWCDLNAAYQTLLDLRRNHRA